MANKYTIKHSEDELYIHFNPMTQEYFVSDKLLGAAIFSEAGGLALMRETELSPTEWNLVSINSKENVKGSRSMEPVLFNATH